MHYPTARLADYNSSGSRERLTLESSYDSLIDGSRRVYINRANHEVGVSLTIEEYSPGGAGKRAYTKQIHMELSRTALAGIIEHLQRGMSVVPGETK
jgi:hypothetical protein